MEERNWEGVATEGGAVGDGEEGEVVGAEEEEGEGEEERIWGGGRGDLGRSGKGIEVKRENDCATKFQRCLAMILGRLIVANCLY